MTILFPVERVRPAVGEHEPAELVTIGKEAERAEYFDLADLHYALRDLLKTDPRRARFIVRLAWKMVGEAPTLPAA